MTFKRYESKQENVIMISAVLPSFFSPLQQTTSATQAPLLGSSARATDTAPLFGSSASLDSNRILGSNADDIFDSNVGSVDFLGTPSVNSAITPPRLGQPIETQPLLGQPISNDPVLALGVTTRPLLGQPVESQPLLGQRILGQPEFGDRFLGQQNTLGSLVDVTI